MPTLLGKTITLGKYIRTGLTLSLALTSLVAVSVPSRAQDFDGAMAKNVLEGIGAVIKALPAQAPTPSQTKIKYVPVYVRHQPHYPRHCWYEGREVYDGYDYIMRRVRVCH